MTLHPDRGATGAPSIRNGVVVHDSEGAEGLLPWGQTSSAQLIAALASPGDRDNGHGGFYGAGYQAVTREDGTFTSVAADNIGPYHCGAGINPNMWSICIPGRAAQTRVQWLSDVSRFYIRGVAAYIVDRWHHDHHVWPLEFRSGAQLAADRANITGHPTGYTSHAQVTASHLTSTDHSDPGPSFPWDVLAADIALLVSPLPPHPTPSTLEEDMPDQLYRKQGKAAIWKGDRRSRTHVTSEATLALLIPDYGAVILLDESADLGTMVGKTVVGNDPGDI